MATLRWDARREKWVAIGPVVETDEAKRRRLEFEKKKAAEIIEFWTGPGAFDKLEVWEAPERVPFSEF